MSNLKTKKAISLTSNNHSSVQKKKTSIPKTTSSILQLQQKIGNKGVERLFESNVLQKKENNTGLPDNLKNGIESLSGYAMDDVKVHYNSSKPTQLNAHAFAQGSDIHLAVGQEKHLPHEAWHIVQQKQGRVQPTRQMKGKVSINDDESLEREANLMSSRALQRKEIYTSASSQTVQKLINSNIIQCESCQDVYGVSGFPETTDFVSDKEAVKTRARDNINSWTPHLLRRLDEEIGNLFAREEELLWWSNWATGLVMSILDNSIPKPISTAISAMASIGEHIVGQSIANARGQLVSIASRAIVDMQTSQRLEAESFIDNSFVTLRLLVSGECGRNLQSTYSSIEELYPILSSENYGQLGELTTQLLDKVRMAQFLSEIEQEYESCVALNLYRPAGIPSEEEQQARESCRRETGYLPNSRVN